MSELRERVPRAILSARFGDLQLILSGGWWTCFWSKSGARRAGRRNVVTVCSRLLCPLRAVGGGWAQLVSLPRRRLPRVGDRLGSGQGVIRRGSGWRPLRVEWLDRLRAGRSGRCCGHRVRKAGTLLPGDALLRVDDSVLRIGAEDAAPAVLRERSFRTVWEPWLRGRMTAKVVIRGRDKVLGTHRGHEPGSGPASSGPAIPSR
jgi:hypothetical protein